jgi:nucleoside transporter
MKTSLRIQLSVMMFLQFCVWGAWYGQLSKYLTNQLHATGDQVGLVYASFSVAMIVAPFFIGMLADRFFAAQRVLGILNLTGAAILVWITQINDPDLFFWVMLLYCLTFAPTVSLTSSIALRHIVNPGKDFPSIRLFGTFAWIFIVNIVGFMGIGDRVDIFYLSITAAIAIGLFSFFLPDTPPTSTGPSTLGQIIGTDAFVLFKDRSFLIFFISSIAVCVPLSFYYTWANPSLTDTYLAANPGAEPGSFNIENKMSLGQVSEIFFMLILPFAYQRWGVKKILIIGLLAWIVRFIFFGAGNAGSGVWMLYSAILLHGMCFDFFFVTGMVYTDAKAGLKIKAQAQGLITFATYGVGMFIGSIVAGKVKDLYTEAGVTNWFSVWLVPAAIAAVVLILFLVFFKDNTVKASATIQE